MKDKTLNTLKDYHTQEQLLSIFDYNEETGILYWRESRGCVAKGYIAGTKHNKGYLSIVLDKIPYLVHRVIWCMYYGNWPTDYIDHINGNRSDNSILNLRLATRSENAKNHPKRLDNTSGIKGVIWDKRRNKWIARVQNNNTRYDVGGYDSIEEAELEIKKFREQLHNEFCNHGD